LTAVVGSSNFGALADEKDQIDDFGPGGATVCTSRRSAGQRRTRLQDTGERVAVWRWKISTSRTASRIICGRII